MEVVLEPVVSELLNGLFKLLRSSEVRDFARQLVGGVNSEIKELENKLRHVANLLGDMEDKQLSDDSVKNWFDNLQQWAYDAEDLLDEFAYEALRRKMKAQHQASSSKGLSCLSASFHSRSFAVQMGSKIKKINSRLEKLRQQRSDERQDQVLSGLPPTNVAAPQKPEETSSVPPEQVVYGRDDDKAELLKMVKDGANFQVIAVVGMGGIGKTTIARQVYNHESEDFKFEKKAWVCVSTTFDVLKISKELLQQISEPQKFCNLNEVQVKLKEAVSGKKFLIVFDDIWEVEYNEWEKLKSPFVDGAPGSMMIVTTRDTDVAQKIRCSHTYKLNFLSDQACESLFKENAFGTGAAAVPNQISDSIYKRVVERCGGLPLAAKTLGSLLRFKQSGDWKHILESKIWSTSDGSDLVLPVLKLSYYYLPSNLKRCFGYCAIFPQDYEFEEKELALLWIAEGIVQPSHDQPDLASVCFKKLCSRSLFQQSNSHSSKYVMHDLVHVLAQSVFKGISFRSEQIIDELPEKLRYFTYEPDGHIGKNKFEALEKAKSLRTFLHVRHGYGFGFSYYVSATIIFDLLPKLKMLRVLSFEGYKILYLSNSIGDMIHLRYLNFSNTSIKSLPESTSQLLNLQTLLLKDCSYLMELPSNMRHLINLCHLDISGRNLLKEMPLGMKELKSLQVLSNFIVGKNTCSNLEDLKSLSSLQGELHISELQNVTDPSQIPEQVLNNKSELKVLLLEGRNKWGHQVNSLKADIEMNLLDKLKPPSNLKELIIRGYGGESFPSWLGHGSWLSNLVVLKLENCKWCTSLPSLEMLSSLEDLTIEKMKSLKRIDYQTPFKSLKFLCFKYLKEWEYWDNSIGENFPELRMLSIKACPQLIGKVPDYLSSLKRLVIEHCPKLVVSFSNHPMHCELEIGVFKGMVCNDGSIDFEVLNSQYLANIPTVKDKLKEGSQGVDFLKIVGNKVIVESWRDLENVNFLSNLIFLEIWGCRNLTSIERRMLPSSVRTLRICGCHSITFLKDLSVCSLLEFLGIDSCASLKCVSFDGPLPKKLNHLRVFGCKTLETLSIYIKSCEELKSIGESSDNNTCLPEFVLESSKNLESSPLGLHHLPCLEYIEIVGCPKLSVREGVLTSLRQLLINECEDGKGMGMRMLPSLKCLQIKELPQLKSISDFIKPISLEELIIGSLPLLEVIPNLNGLTCLRRLSINRCQKLKLIPSLSGLTSFERLDISNLPQLESIQDLSNLISLKSLEISDLPQLVTIPSLSNLTSLESLDISSLQQLESIQDLSNLTSLDSLKINCLPQLGTIQSLSGLSSLKILKISDLKQLGIIPSLSGLNSLKSLEINDLPQLGTFPSLGGLTSLERLDISDLPLLESIQDLRNLTSLTKFIIYNCPRIKSIPHLSGPTSNGRLDIFDCRNLISILDLGNFKYLSINGCPKLKSLQTLPSSLQSLEISRCPLLKKRWKSVSGKYSSKIAQIPEVHIDGKFIYNSKKV